MLRGARLNRPKFVFMLFKGFGCGGGGGHARAFILLIDNNSNME